MGYSFLSSTFCTSITLTIHPFSALLTGLVSWLMVNLHYATWARQKLTTLIENHFTKWNRLGEAYIAYSQSQLRHLCGHWVVLSNHLKLLIAASCHRSRACRITDSQFKKSVQVNWHQSMLYRCCGGSRAGLHLSRARRGSRSRFRLKRPPSDTYRKWRNDPHCQSRRWALSRTPSVGKGDLIVSPL